MLEWLQPVLDLLKSLKFIHIVNSWEGAVVVRRGRYARTLESGIRWTWPLLDTVLVCNVLRKPTDIGPLALTTEDGYTIVASAVVSWVVGDPHKYLFEVEDGREVLHDAASGALAHAVLLAPWDTVRAEPFLARVARDVRRAASRYGIRVLGLRWTGLAQVRPMLLLASPGLSAAPLAPRLAEDA